MSKDAHGKPSFVVHSYPVYIADWRDSETRLRLDLEQRGLLWELIFFAAKEGSLPTDNKTLVKIAGCSDAEFERCWPAIASCFEERNGRLHHQRVDKTLLELEGYRTRRSKAGAEGSKKRWQADSKRIAMPSEKNGNAILLPSQSHCDSDSKPIASSTTTSTTTATQLLHRASASSPAADSPISDDDPVFPNTTISKPYTEPSQALDQLSISLVNRLISKHWTASNAPAAIGRMERILANAVNPLGIAADIEANHASWAAWHRAHPRERKKRLEYWLADGDYLHPVSGYAAAPAIPVIDEAPVVVEELSDEELAALDAQRVQERLQEALR